jgi:hypothetical protein
MATFLECTLCVLSLGIGDLARAGALPTETLSHGATLSEKAPKPRTGGGFEKAKWRMSLKALKAAYPQLKEGPDGNYALDEDVSGYPALVIFYFADGFGLSRVLVLFKDSITTAPDALRIFNDLEDKLGKQYGLPNQSSEWWSVKPSKITEGAREQSIATGGLQMGSTWAGARTQIMLSVGKTRSQERPGTTLTYLSTDGPLKGDWLQAGALPPPALDEHAAQ